MSKWDKRESPPAKPLLRASGSQGLRLCLGACVLPAAGSGAVHSSGDTGVWIHPRRVVTWNWLYCPFSCRRTLLGVSIKKVGPGETGGRTRLHLHDHRLPKNLSQRETPHPLCCAPWHRAAARSSAGPGPSIAPVFTADHGFGGCFITTAFRGGSVRYCWLFLIQP